MSTEITQWVDPTGVVTTLDVDWEADGRFMPPPIFQEDVIPGQPGSVLRMATDGPKDVTIRIVFTATGEGDLRTQLRNMMRSMHPLRGDGILRVTSPLGDQREIVCRYRSGLEMKETLEAGGFQSQTADVTFHAFYPYWRDVSDNVQPFTINAGPNFFPIFPIRLTSSQIAVDGTMTNTGDVDTWPVWNLQGPGSTIKLRNLTTGRFLAFLTTALGPGESVTIDTRPTSISATGKTIYRQDGANLMPDMDPMSALWELVPGNNAVRLEMSGAVGGASSLQLSWRGYWLAV